MILFLTLVNDGFVTGGWRTGALATRFAMISLAEVLLPMAEASEMRALLLPGGFVFSVLGGELAFLATGAIAAESFGAALAASVTGTAFFALATGTTFVAGTGLAAFATGISFLVTTGIFAGFTTGAAAMATGVVPQACAAICGRLLLRIVQKSWSAAFALQLASPWQPSAILSWKTLDIETSCFKCAMSSEGKRCWRNILVPLLQPTIPMKIRTRIIAVAGDCFLKSVLLASF
mmetsp:Transcript_86237/g.165966  ORF Transcript_86237/g.165966 Transcript_86237/m.165966 type:complete len:234 (+) Transcript_86237:783-1484(+)